MRRIDAENREGGKRKRGFSAHASRGRLLRMEWNPEIVTGAAGEEEEKNENEKGRMKGGEGRVGQHFATVETPKLFVETFSALRAVFPGGFVHSELIRLSIAGAGDVVHARSSRREVK